MNSLKGLSLSLNERRVMLLGMAISLVARGMAAFSHGFAVDDMLWMNFPFSGDIVSLVAVGDGRFLYPWLIDLCLFLGLDTPKAYGLSAFFLMATFVYCAILSCRLWRVSGDLPVCFFIAAILASFPFISDIFTWKLSMLIGAFPFLFSMIGLYIAAENRSWLLGAVMIACSLAVHQLGFAWVAASFSLSCMLSMSVPTPGMRTIRQRLSDYSVIPQLWAIAAGAIFYLLAWQMIRATTLESPAAFHRTGTLPFVQSRWVARIAEVSDYLIHLNPFFSSGTFGLLILLAGLHFTTLVCILLKHGYKSGNAWGRVSISIFALISALGATLIFVIAPMETVYPVRTMAPLSLIIGALMANVTMTYRQGVLRGGVLVATGLLCLSFVGVSNQMLSDQQRANRRDEAFANRIVAALGQLPGFAGILNVAVVGQTDRSYKGMRFADDLSQMPPSHLGTVSSVFATNYSNQHRVQLLNEISGYRFGPNLTESERTVAEGYCKTVAPFPSSYSIAMHGTLAIVCL